MNQFAAHVAAYLYVYGLIVAAVGSLIAVKRWWIPRLNHWWDIHTTVLGIKEMKQMVLDNAHINGEILGELTKIRKGVAAQEQVMLAMLIEHEHAWFRTDSKGKWSYVNRTLTRMLQRSFDELAGDGWVTCVHEHDREAVLREWNSAVEHGRDFGWVFRFVLPSGNSLRVRMRGWIQRCSDGSIIGVMGTTAKVDPSGKRENNPDDTVSGLNNLMAGE